jgi:hypothetical protein
MPLYPFIFPPHKRVLDVYLLNQSLQIFTSPKSFKDSCCLVSRSTTIYYKSHQISSLLLKTLSARLALWLRLKINAGLKYLVKLNHTFISRGSHSKTKVQPQFLKSNLQLLFCPCFPFSHRHC